MNIYPRLSECTYEQGRIWPPATATLYVRVDIDGPTGRGSFSATVYSGDEPEILEEIEVQPDRPLVVLPCDASDFLYRLLERWREMVSSF